MEVFDYISFEFCVQTVPASTARQFSLGPVLGMESFSSDEKQGADVATACVSPPCSPALVNTRVDISSPKHATTSTAMGALWGHFSEDRERRHFLG